MKPQTEQVPPCTFMKSWHACIERINKRPVLFLASLLFILLMFNIFFTPYRSTLCYAENGNLCNSDVGNLFMCANLAAVLRRSNGDVYCRAGTLNIKKCRDCVVPFSLWQRHSMNPQDGCTTVISLCHSRALLPNVLSVFRCLRCFLIQLQVVVFLVLVPCFFTQ